MFHIATGVQNGLGSAVNAAAITAVTTKPCVTVYDTRLCVQGIYNITIGSLCGWINGCILCT